MGDIATVKNTANNAALLVLADFGAFSLRKYKGLLPLHTQIHNRPIKQLYLKGTFMEMRLDFLEH